MTKEEARSSVMGAISMALKDPVLQQGFEIICKNLSEFEKENAELREALKGKRCNCMTYFNFKDLEKELGQAKEIIEEFMITETGGIGYSELYDKAEAFLYGEVEK